MTLGLRVVLVKGFLWQGLQVLEMKSDASHGGDRSVLILLLPYAFATRYEHCALYVLVVLVL